MRHSLLLTALLLMCLPVLACAGDTADDLLQKAKAAWEKKQPDEAIKLAGKAIDLDPKNAEAYLLRGVMYEALDKHAEAIADFDQSLKLDPKAADAYEHRGSEQFKLGKIAESIADFD
jgi:lipoprotein NlpI